ncbi:metal-binding protein [Deinococcus aquiradiocola]|uniref:Hydrolase n=1 Tax=Deinococcus aquiradiocola TaxID=393059 RepID=A0A917PSF3_9DEIO|nr:metal-binding protein [Deinococcus aquiradiocola]GGJ90082.1 hydrolase [Deinococcus aquiradiocola]
MPSGRVHNLINIGVYAGLAGLALYLHETRAVVVSPAQALTFTAGYAVGTFLLSPDLDLAEGNVDSKRHWGFLGALWVPYGLMFSHRGLSHTWVIGPLTRLLYLSVMVAIVWGALQFLLPHDALLTLRRTLDLRSLGAYVWSTGVAVPLLAGYYLSQWLHLTADGVRPDHGLRHGGRKLRGAARRWR